MNNESERGYLESFKADPYEMFEQVARPLSRCRFTYRGRDRNGGKGGLKRLQRAEHIVLSLSRIYNSRPGILFFEILSPLATDHESIRLIVRRDDLRLQV